MPHPKTEWSVDKDSVWLCPLCEGTGYIHRETSNLMSKYFWRWFVGWCQFIRVKMLAYIEENK